MSAETLATQSVESHTYAHNGLEPSVDAAVAAEVPPDLRVIELGRKQYKTNVPEDIELYDTGDIIFPPRIHIAELDKLTAGDFTLTGSIQYQDREGTHTQELIDKLTIYETPQGKAVSEAPLDGGTGWIMAQKSAPLMEALGFVVGDKNGHVEEVKAVPTPLSLKAAAAKLGVDVIFFDKVVKINGTDYLKAYADKKYPVSFGYYQHDVEDDHVTGVVLGGEPLKLALSNFATEALRQSDDKAISQGALLIDVFTALLRNSMVSDSIAQDSRKGLYRVGESMEMPREQIDGILTEAESRAKLFGIVPSA